MRMMFKGMIAVVACLSLMACGTAEDQPSRERGHLGKADVVGSCKDQDGDELCGGKGTGTCYCDDSCSNYGDCCDDLDAVCSDECSPATCEALGKQCDNWPDGCGGKLNCGECASGQVCDDQGQCVTKAYPQTLQCTVGAEEPFEAKQPFLLVMNQSRSAGLLLSQNDAGDWELVADKASASIDEEGSLWFGVVIIRPVEEGDSFPQPGCLLKRVWEFQVGPEMTGTYQFNGFYLPTEGLDGCDEFHLGHPPVVAISCQAY